MTIFLKDFFLTRGSDCSRRQTLSKYYERGASRGFTAPTPIAPTRRFERIPQRDHRLKYLAVIVVQIEYCTKFCEILDFVKLRVCYIGVT